MHASTALDSFGERADLPLVLVRIVQPATATPPAVNGNSTSLSVLGEDALGESVLRYTWTVASSPAGAQVSFSDNAANSAKNTIATFSMPGRYTIRCTLTNGLFAVVSSTEVLVWGEGRKSQG